MARKRYRGGSWAHLNMLRRGVRNSLGAAPVEAVTGPPAADGWDVGVDGANATASYTDGTGGSGGTGLVPILDVIDVTSRRLSGIDFSPDGLICVVCSYSGEVATFTLSTAYDVSTASLLGTALTGQTLATNVHFNEDGTHVTFMRSTDILSILPVATAYTIDGDTVSVDTLTKTELMGYSSSHDPIHTMAQDGTGVWSYGRIDVTTHTIVWTPLGTAYDFGTPGTPVSSNVDYTNIVSTPVDGGIIASSDGKTIQMFSGAAAQTMQNFELAVGFTPDGTEVNTSSSDLDITQNFDMASWSKDYERLFVWNGPFTPVLYEFALV